ncbi:MAG TPA: PAS domain S-box protein, partial [Gemmatimonadaceae bacterium]|nr:PAS domain S-box protein [Gemmatimonadaceae bacterium]
LVVNNAFIRTFGFTREEAIGQTAITLGLYANPQDRRKIVDIAGEKGSVRDYEVMIHSKSGSPVHVMTFAERIELDGKACLLTMSYDISDRKRVEDELRRSEAYLADSQKVSQTGSWGMLPDAGGLFWSQELYRIFGFDPSGGPPHGPTVVERIHPDERDRVDKDIRHAISEGREVAGEYRYFMPNGVMKHLRFLGHPVDRGEGGPREYLGTVVDVTSQKIAEAQLNATLSEVRALASSLVQAQDDERRRIARELHETTAQDLAALKMNIAALQRTAAIIGDKDRSLLAESALLAEQAMTQIRTLSYLLHPPFLDEVGLASAIRWFAKGFENRSGVSILLSLPYDFPRLPQDIEIALFRVIQESLINIHRHAESPRAEISIGTADGELTLEVRDAGRGMPHVRDGEPYGSEHLLGVGIGGMRERMEQLGGSLEIDSTPRGTTVRAWLAIPGDSQWPRCDF